MNKLPWMKFYPSEWVRDTALAKCSLATRGMWFEAILAMYDSPAFGTLEGTVEELSQVCRCTQDQFSKAVDELRRTGTADVTCNADVTLGNTNVTLVCRRMQREEHKRVTTRERVRKHRCNASVTGEKQEARSKSTEVHPPNPPKGGNARDEQTSLLSFPNAPGSKGGSTTLHKTTKGSKSERERALNGDAQKIYKAYPRLKQPDDAIKAIKKRLAEYDAAYLLERTKLFAERCKGQTEKYIPYPATWFNSGGFKEDPNTWGDGERTSQPASQKGWLTEDDLAKSL